MTTARSSSPARSILGNGLKALGSWWLAELLALLPTRLRDWLAGRPTRWLWLQPTENGLELQIIATGGRVVRREAIPDERCQGKSLDDILRAASLPRSLPTILCLPEGALFERSFLIPAAALPHLPLLVAQEIERRTPFRPSEIFVGNRTEPEAGDRQKLRVHQRIVKRTLVEAAWAKLGLAGALPTHVAPTDEIRAIEGIISLSPPPTHKGSWLGLIVRGLLVLAFCLLAALFAIVWWSEQQGIDALNAQLPTLQAKARLVRQKLEEADSTRASVQALLGRAAMPRTIELWEEISRILPDDCWLTDFSVEDQRVTLSGLSRNAAGLVAVLGTSHLLKGVALNAPITADPVAQRERFSIVAQLVQPGP